MNKFLFSFILIALFITKKANAQSGDFGSSASCEYNVNEPPWATAYDDMKRATFKFAMTQVGSGNCTAVLINQYVNQNQQEQYFLTAKHCLDGTNSNTEFHFIFNYQSKDSYNSSVPNENIGSVLNQSGAPNSLIPSITDNNGYQSYFTSPITIIDESGALGDMALCKINNPIPPHFNVYYAGWIPHSFTYTTALFDIVYGSPNGFRSIHHPEGDIKKISRETIVVPFDNPVNVGCTVITTIIDWLACHLFGWCNVNTSIICNYVDVPFYFSPGATGTLESGSSGSPLFSNSGQILGTFSASCLQSQSAPKAFPPCDIFQTNPCATINDFWWYKFKFFYRRNAVKNALNPSHNTNVDLFGLSGRQISCNDYLNLGEQIYNVGSKTYHLGGQYYPLGNYQSNNHLELHANLDINFTAPIHIHDGSDYTFSAGGNINGTNELTIDNPQDVTLKPGDATLNCNPNSYKIIETDPLQDIIASFPKSKKFDVNEHSDITTLKIYPNPSKEELNISYLTDKNYSLQILDPIGKTMFNKEYKSDGLLHEQKNILNISNYADGFYIIKAQTEDGNVISKKILKQ